jgi:ABC-type multidrug transport system fused ATPase/permease subunit
VSFPLFDLALLNLLQLLPIVGAAGSASTSMTRIDEFLTISSVKVGSCVEQGVSNGLSRLELVNASFGFGGSVEPVVANVTLSVTSGQIVFVTGQVGSGKTSLLRGILGELTSCSGTVRIFGSLSYSPQQSWVMNASIRSNVLFGLPFDQVKYWKVIHSVLLEQELRSFAGGDFAIVTEGGTNLSGGQRQRLALARALYAGRDIVMLDDPLSAVDAQVERKAMNRVRNLLVNQCVIISTNNNSLAIDGEVVLVLENGNVRERVNDLEKETAALDVGDENVAENEMIEDFYNVFSAEPEQPQELKLERIKLQSVKATRWLVYVSKMGAWFWMFVLALLLAVANLVFADYWISLWVDGTLQLAANVWLPIYVALSCWVVALTFIVVILFSKAYLTVSRFLHDAALQALMGTEIEFFQRNALGDIMGRFSRC